MKHLKITSVLLSAAMCFSMLTSPVMADEAFAPDETQVEETEKDDETQQEEPAGSEKGSEEQVPEVTEEAPLESEDSRDRKSVV